jgi:hypothetical protein
MPSIPMKVLMGICYSIVHTFGSPLILAIDAGAYAAKGEFRKVLPKLGLFIATTGTTVYFGNMALMEGWLCGTLSIFPFVTIRSPFFDIFTLGDIKRKAAMGQDQTARILELHSIGFRPTLNAKFLRVHLDFELQYTPPLSNMNFSLRNTSRVTRLADYATDVFQGDKPTSNNQERNAAACLLFLDPIHSRQRMQIKREMLAPLRGPYRDMTDILVKKVGMPQEIAGLIFNFSYGECGNLAESSENLDLEKASKIVTFNPNRSESQTQTAVKKNK